jgi:hypothetical protein
MTNEKINAAIAETCGWTKINVEHRSGISPTNGLMMGAEFFPNYCTDLNAMHEAERSLHEPLREMYVCKLLGKVADSPTYLWDILTAHPRSRAEAFLKTLGKWEESK